MLLIGNKEPSVIRIGSKVVQSLYLGAVLLWEAVSSCFGKGIWLREKPWVGSDPWRNP